MRDMRAKRYSVNRQYRGRKKGSTVLKVLVAALAVLLAAGVLFILLLEIEYTDDGVKVTLPWLQKEPVPEQPAPDVSDLIITEEPTSSPTAAPDPLSQRLAAVEVEPSAVTDGTAAGLASDAGGSALVVTVKDVEGRLAWQSRSELAQSARGNDGETLNGEDAFSQAVRALSQKGELYLVARMNCFQDLWMCVYDKSMALTNASGKLWYDSNGMPWLSPANENAREYLTGLCLELAELGFDEILLDCAGFPGSGRLTNIASGGNYPAGGLEQAVSGWLSDLREALTGSGVLLSVRLGGEALTGESSTGLTAAGLEKFADRVWIAGMEDISACADALTQSGMDKTEQRLVLTTPIQEGVREDWTGNWADLLE